MLRCYFVPNVMHFDMNNRKENDSFKVVSRRRPRKGGAFKYQITPFVASTRNFPDCHIDKTTAIRRIHSAKEDFEYSDYYKSFDIILKECLSNLGCKKVVEILCLGIGHIGDCTISRYQLALLLCLREKFDVRCLVHDPIFYSDECDILKTLDFDLIKENEEGKHSIRSDGITIVYLPHCPKQLTNNFLWKNWDINLKNCVLICNSFTSLIESQPHKELDISAPYIINIFAHTIEYSLVNSFKFNEVFNDTSIHSFPPQLLDNITPNFWIRETTEPDYHEDIEFISSDLVGRLKIKDTRI